LERALLHRFTGFDQAEFDSDPNWIALQLELASLHEAETRAAVCLLRAEPTTLAGESVRGWYVAARTRSGHQWSSVAA
jgi:hypothetical protein